MNPRNIALKVINDVLLNNAYANIALNKEISKENITDLDRKFITELIYGTIKTHQTLDWYLTHFIVKKNQKIAPIIKNILRMGLYQMLYMDKIPVSAACNESVKLTKKYGHVGTVKFVNGILRNASRTISEIKLPDIDADPVSHLSLKYFHPQWLIAKWYQRYGLENCEKLCQINNTAPPLTLRVNTLKTSRDNVIEDLVEAKVKCEKSIIVPEGIICYEHGALKHLNALSQGYVQVQDEGSMLVAHILDPKEGDYIIDTCAAPGGKSTHIAALMKNKGKIISCDIHPHKLSLIEENATRLGINIIETKLQDALNIGDEYPNSADKVLVDAPCSGLGVLRRKADSRWNKTPKTLEELPQLQIDILLSAAKAVKPGGVLVYSTCTIEPAENEEVIKKFLAERKDFILDEAGQFLPIKKTSDTMLNFLPHIHGFDGFFITRLKRKVDAK